MHAPASPDPREVVRRFKRAGFGARVSQRHGARVRVWNYAAAEDFRVLYYDPARDAWRSAGHEGARASGVGFDEAIAFLKGGAG